MKPEKTTTYYDSGSVMSEVWRLNDKLHRTDGPAYIHYDRDESVWYKEWRLHGNFHREDGPAFIYYFTDGSVRKEVWYIEGVTLEDI